ncbi:MAG: ABC transporter ATP-binding protein [Alphaproteobacteria bacterium]|nr:MAG: ABC transporter ATP-binding protein [Alphaproteobacteria bacterium]
MLKLIDIHHSYRQGDQSLEILRGASLHVKRGEMVALVAPSGTGKSTLLHIAGLLESPTSGEIMIDNASCANLSDRKRSAMRAEKIGFVYQFHHLLPEFSAIENIMLPQMIAGISSPMAKQRAAILLDRVGLGARAAHRPMQLSGGEQQRVAILRALANDPKILLADEPTGNLDIATGDLVFDMMRGFVQNGNMAALIVTHNLDLAKKMDRIYTIRQGRVELMEAPSLKVYSQAPA